jgi:dolichol-phosphate mannosyltransferase
MGFIISLVSFFMIIAELSLFVFYGREVPGFTTLIVTMLFLFGVLFLILGIIGEYIARIYDEVKRRPNYIVKNDIGFDGVHIVPSPVSVIRVHSIDKK